MIKRNTTPVIDAISEMRITGNIKPPIWRKTIVYTNTKGTFHHSDAADLLADIRYWYTRQEIRDERTSEIIEYRKRFKEDKLQRSYNDIAEYLNCSMKLARQAVKFLADLGVITLEFRNIKQSGGTLYNVMYIELVPSVLQRLTYPDSQMGTADFPNGKTKKPKRENGKAHLGGTYTENTPETTNKENNTLSEVANAPTDGAGLNELRRQLELANEYTVERLNELNSDSANNAHTENATGNMVDQFADPSKIIETENEDEDDFDFDSLPYIPIKPKSSEKYVGISQKTIDANPELKAAIENIKAQKQPENTEPVQTIDPKKKDAPRAPKQPKTESYQYKDGTEFDLKKSHDAFLKLFTEWRSNTSPPAAALNEFKKILSVDKREPDHIRALFVYLKKRGKAQNGEKLIEVESIAALRTKFERLETEMNRNQPKIETVAANTPPTLDQLQADYQRRQQKNSKL